MRHSPILREWLRSYPLKFASKINAMVSSHVVDDFVADQITNWTRGRDNATPNQKRRKQEIERNPVKNQI